MEKLWLLVILIMMTCVLSGCGNESFSSGLLRQPETDFQNITVNGTLDFGDEKLPTALFEKYRSPGDGFEIRYEHNFEGFLNNDYYVIRKTDGNDFIPDGGVAIVMSNASGDNRTVFNIDGFGKITIANYSNCTVLATDINGNILCSAGGTGNSTVNLTNYFTKAQYWANATAGFYTKAQDNANFSKYTLKTGQTGMSGLLTGTQSWYSSSGYVNATAFKATRINTSKLVVTGLSAASCDVKSYTNGSFYCGTDATSSGSNPPRTPIIYDELLYWTTAREPFMICAVLSSGTAAVAAPADKRIGVVSFLDSTTANGGYICRTDVASLMYFTGNERAVFGVATPNLASRNNITIIAGFGDATTAAEPTDGCYFYSRNWKVQGRCKNNAGPTSTATNLTMTQNQKYIWEILNNNAATSVRFTAYNYTTCTNLTQVGNGLYTSCTQLWTNTVGANIPTIAGREFGFEFYAFQSSIDAGAILVNWDFARLER